MYKHYITGYNSSRSNYLVSSFFMQSNPIYLFSCIVPKLDVIKMISDKLISNGHTRINNRGTGLAVDADLSIVPKCKMLEEIEPKNIRVGLDTRLIKDVTDIQVVKWFNQQIDLLGGHFYNTYKLRLFPESHVVTRTARNASILSNRILDYRLVYVLLNKGDIKLLKVTLDKAYLPSIKCEAYRICCTAFVGPAVVETSNSVATYPDILRTSTLVKVIETNRFIQSLIRR